MASANNDGLQKGWTGRTRRLAMALGLAGGCLVGVMYSCSETPEQPPTVEGGLAELRDADSQATGTQAVTDASLSLPAVPREQRTAVTSERTTNREASVPPQCYTKTEGRYNPCYACHQLYPRREDDRLNVLDDGALQGSYNFSELGEYNHWRNLFIDRRDWVASIGDAIIDAYVDQDNYESLAARLRGQAFEGFVPDLQNYADGSEAFDAQGLAKDGSHWVAFNYKPFLGTFWPTNGATDDVVIRLAAPFRQLDGEFDRDVYYVNLTLVELNLKRLGQAELWPVDESRLGVDLNGDGELGVTADIVARTSYVGDAADVPVEFQQVPAETELMHSVRYLGVTEDDEIYLPRRMKELRYMRKVRVLPRDTVVSRYANERKEKRLGELPNFLFEQDEGFDNALGWYIQGFIEDYDGELRPQSYEEGVFCMGCHSAVGTTTDSTFSLVRKITGGEGWGYIDLHGMQDAPSAAEPGGEILNYLRRSGGGNEFRENPEMIGRWFNADGTLNEEKIKAADVYTLLAPSAERARQLNKAYTHIVRHQSFIQGRDPTTEPARNVFEKVDQQVPPLEREYRYYGWDPLLDWSQ